MASTEDSFREAVRQMFGDKWEVIGATLTRGEWLLRCHVLREIPPKWWDGSKAHAGAFLDRVGELHREMVAEIDPKGAERERAHVEGRKLDGDRIRTLEAELAGARAIIADLFRQAREGGA